MKLEISRYTHPYQFTFDVNDINSFGLHKFNRLRIYKR